MTDEIHAALTRNLSDADPNDASLQEREALIAAGQQELPL